ncbi:MAG: aminodeoxychorismate lyase [Gammaproteobacteria bacterium]|nr:aminodeoxychorismate lyase [Gammaproteobacteria bacterium]
MQFLVNGKPQDVLVLTDRAIHYGDGVFETVALRNGQLELWPEHMARLQTSCQRLGFSAPQPLRLLHEAQQVSHGLSQAVIKIIVTRGEGGRGYRPPATPSPNRIVAVYPWSDYPPHHGQAGVNLRICQTRLGLNPTLAGIKHLNRLEQVLARAEWENPEIAEGLMLDIGGHVVEGTQSNLFFVEAGVLHTPDLSNCGVAGIMRGVILELAANSSIPTHVGHYSVDRLNSADEVFISNSIIGLWPVVRIEQQSYRPGPIFHSLNDALDHRRQRQAIPCL